MIEAMSDEQLKDYVLNRPESLRSVKTGKNAPGKKVGTLALRSSFIEIQCQFPVCTYVRCLL